MTSGKNYNSIVFLTTLSVYLGLVLVGGVTPSVLAQAATTRNFNVQDETEVKDDLDKKPDDKDFLEADFPALFIDLLREIKNQSLTGKVSSPLTRNFGVSAQYEIFRSGIGSGSAFGGEMPDAQLKQIIQNAVDKKFYRAAVKSADYFENKTKSIEVNLNADASEWVLDVSFTKNNADKFVAFLDRKFARADKLSKATISQKVYRNSLAQVSSLINKRVSISIRLPRSDIDDFLANKDAQ